MINTFQEIPNPGRNLLEMPIDMLLAIFTYLAPEDIARLEKTCRYLNECVGSDGVWQTYLDRLRGVDRREVINTLTLHFNLSSTRFKASFNRISDGQLEEIDHFINCIQSNKIYLPDDILQSLTTMMMQPATQLHTLEQRHLFLNEINARLIRSQIRLNFPELYIAGNHLTRFPNELFEEEDLQGYWKALKKLHCDNNKLRALPNALGRCTSLELLFCSKNELHHVPDSLGSIEQPLTLICDSNHIGTFSGSIHRKFGEAYCYSTLRYQTASIEAPLMINRFLIAKDAANINKGRQPDSAQEYDAQSAASDHNSITKGPRP